MKLSPGPTEGLPTPTNLIAMTLAYTFSSFTEPIIKPINSKVNLRRHSNKMFNRIFNLMSLLLRDVEF
jgi:hypothetical protein